MKNGRKLNIPGGDGVFYTIAENLKLVWKLWLDPRVNLFLKLLPVGSLLYIISPFDFIIPVVDDVGVAWLLTYLFIELCPQDIVEEHRRQIRSTVEGKVTENYPDIDEESIEDARFRSKEDE